MKAIQALYDEMSSAGAARRFHETGEPYEIEATRWDAVRAELKELFHGVPWVDANCARMNFLLMGVPVVAPTTEIERLRAALEDICTASHGDEARAIAEKALGRRK